MSPSSSTKGNQEENLAPLSRAHFLPAGTDTALEGDQLNVPYSHLYHRQGNGLQLKANHGDIESDSHDTESTEPLVQG